MKPSSKSTMKIRDSRATKFQEEELSIIIEYARKNGQLMFTPRNKINAKGKDKLWVEITEKINAIAPQQRNMSQIQCKWSDWVYQTKKKRKKGKTIYKIEQRLLDVIDNIRSRSSDEENDVTTNDTANDDQHVDNSPKHMAFHTNVQQQPLLSKEDLHPPKYTDEDKSMIVNFVALHKKVLFGPLNILVTQNLKNLLWQKLADMITIASGHQRTATSVKEKWSKWASKVKGKAANIKRLQRHSSGMNDTHVDVVSAVLSFNYNILTYIFHI